jgi:hypothetical protein
MAEDSKITLKENVFSNSENKRIVISLKGRLRKGKESNFKFQKKGEQEKNDKNIPCDQQDKIRNFRIFANSANNCHY